MTTTEYFTALRVHRDDISEYFEGAEKLSDEDMQLIAEGIEEAVMDVFWVYIDQLDEVGFFDRLGLTRKANR